MGRIFLLTFVIISFGVCWVYSEPSDGSRTDISTIDTVIQADNNRRIREIKQGKRKGKTRGVKKRKVKRRNGEKSKGKERKMKRRKKKSNGKKRKKKNRKLKRRNQKKRNGKKRNKKKRKAKTRKQKKRNGGNRKEKKRKAKTRKQKKRNGRKAKRKQRKSRNRKRKERNREKGTGKKRKSKNRKQKRRKTIKNKRKKLSRTSCLRNTSSGVNGTCLDSAVSYLNMLAGVVANFDKQKNRMEKQNKTGGSKSGKKGLFKPLVDRLIQAGGGNKSKMTCGGKEGTAGAKQLSNLTAKFEECESKINESCNPANFPKPNKTRLDACFKATKNFSDSVKACIKKKDAEACTCWLDSKLNSTSKEVKTCSFKKEADLVAKQLKACKSAFSVCRKYEDDTIKSLSACSKSEDKLKEKAKQLSTNKAAVEKALAKVNKLTGASGRRTRQASSCSDVVKSVTLLIVIVNQNPASPRVEVVSLEISSVGDVTCSDADKKSLTEKQSGLKESVEKISDAYDTMIEEIKTLSGTAPSAADIAAFQPTTKPVKMTTASSGRRRRILI